MKIAMIGAKGLPATIGGVERHVEELSIRLAAAGFDVVVYDRSSYSGRAAWSERLDRGVRVVTLPSMPTKHLDTISHTLLATLHAICERCDVYHFHGVGPSLLSWLPRFVRPRAHVVSTFHCVDRKHAKWGRFARFALKLGEWAACRFPQTTIAVGEALALYCQNRYGRIPAQISNGVTVPAIISTAEADAVLKDFGLEPRKYLLAVSRLIPHKGVHVIIEAFKKLRAAGEAEGLKLAIVGEASFTDEYVSALRVFAADERSQENAVTENCDRTNSSDVIEIPDTPNILFLGRQNGRTLDALYQNALAFVHASTSEGLPIVVLEAAAAGAVPIVSDIPEHREIISKIGGVTFCVNDAADLAAKISVVIHGRAALPVVGQCLREAVAREYNWDMFTAATAGLYLDFAHSRSYSAANPSPQPVTY